MKQKILVVFLLVSFGSEVIECFQARGQGSTSLWQFLLPRALLFSGALGLGMILEHADRPEAAQSAARRDMDFNRVTVSEEGR